MPAAEPMADRLWRQVEKEEGGCWVWRGTDNGEGYGRIGDRGKQFYVHRVAYELLVGPIPLGLTIDHLCRNHACVNPEHLEPVTQAENNRRAVALITHCPHGHEYTSENSLIRNGNERICRQCDRERQRAKYQREKAEGKRGAKHWIDLPEGERR